jgi:hypothetical protein
MPLSRLNDGFEIELEGIAFGMVDRQGHRWRCLNNGSLDLSLRLQSAARALFSWLFKGEYR